MSPGKILIIGARAGERGGGNQCPGNVAGTYGAMELSGSQRPGSATDGLCGAALSYVVCCETGRGICKYFQNYAGNTGTEFTSCLFTIDYSVNTSIG